MTQHGLKYIALQIVNSKSICTLEPGSVEDLSESVSISVRGKKYERGGFTLIELLVVIAIIVLLMSVLVPSLRRARTSAKRLVCAHNLKQISLAVDLYLCSHDNTYPCAQDPLPTATQQS